MGKGKTIEEVVKNNLCTGCATCVSLCPLSAIGLIKDDSKGIYLPQLDTKECNQCGICFEICPGHSINLKDLNVAIFGQVPEDVLLGNYLNCYIGHATDYNVRYNAASGGLVTAILTFALEEKIIDGALVTTMSRENPLEPQPFIARTREEITSAAKSKYCPVPANIALREILEKEGKYAVVGLPCHLHGVRKAETVNKTLKERIVLHLSVFCSDMPNFKQTEFLLIRLGVRTEEVKALNYRGEGWPGKLSLELKNGKKSLIPYPAYWGGFDGLFLPSRCAVCPDWVSELSDISCGDAWLPEVADDKVGKSVVISRSMRGEDILNQMLCKGKVELIAISGDKAMESQGGFFRKRRDIKARLTISKLFGKKVPTYGRILLPSFSFRAYLRYCLISLQSVIASKRSLWRLLDIYCSLLMFGGQIKSRLRL